MELTDEQLVDALRERGHREAAAALEQKLTAEAAVAAHEREAGLEPLPAGDDSSPAATRARLRRGHAGSDGKEQRRKRRELRGEFDPAKREKGGDDAEGEGDDE